jgi:hypothetical protein
VSEKTPRETPQLGIFWVVQTTDGKAKLLAAGCPLDQAEPYGDCLTCGPGHYETWAQWRRDRTVDPALRALVRLYEYRLAARYKTCGTALRRQGAGDGAFDHKGYDLPTTW